jgi:effector-binding domain-containing protein
MKVLRVILIIVVILVAAVLIVPLFSPATAEVSAETTIMRDVSKIYPSVASFKGRALWDPWLTQDSTAEATIESKPDYVGSTYSWEGEAIGTGRMEVVSARENEYIESNLWFGEVAEPALVEWKFEALEEGTHVLWSFSQETSYPIERLGMMFGKVFLKQSFELGLANLKELMEDMKEQTDPSGSISVITLPAMNVLLADGSGTMEEIGIKLPELYGLVYQAAAEQGLEVVGAPFVDYLDYDESTGFSNYRAGIEVNKMGSDAGEVSAEAYPELEAVQCIHTGPYETLTDTYDALSAYIRDQGLEVAGNAMEFYQIGAMSESDPGRWKTLIAFPLK